jgi:SnoaL-like domain
MRMAPAAREVVMSYIQAMDGRDFAAARRYLQDSIFIKGPAGEAFRGPDDFLKMMEQQRGRYDIEKVFVDGDDVCLLYNFVIEKATVFFCSWYQVKVGRIASIKTIFDPRAFAAGPPRLE